MNRSLVIFGLIVVSNFAMGMNITDNGTTDNGQVIKDKTSPAIRRVLAENRKIHDGTDEFTKTKKLLEKRKSSKQSNP